MRCSTCSGSGEVGNRPNESICTDCRSSKWPHNLKRHRANIEPIPPRVVLPRGMLTMNLFQAGVDLGDGGRDRD